MDQLAKLDPEFNAFLDAAITQTKKQQRDQDLDSIAAIQREWLESKYSEDAEEISPETQELYFSEFKKYAEFCRDNNVPALPTKPEFLGTYLHEKLEAGLAYATLRVISAAVQRAHAVKKLPGPTDEIISGILKGSTQTQKEKV